MNQSTLVLIKCAAVRRGLMGEIIKRIEQKHLTILAMEMRNLHPDHSLPHRHYEEHKGKPYYDRVIAAITGLPVVALWVKGWEAIKVMRLMIGNTFGHTSDPGTIRGDFANGMDENLIHGSDSVESAQRELALWFPDKVGASS